jgi:hypothetical protein
LQRSECARRKVARELLPDTNELDAGIAGEGGGIDREHVWTKPEKNAHFAKVFKRRQSRVLGTLPLLRGAKNPGFVAKPGRVFVE